MSHYRKIDVRIWNDARFMSLSLEGRLAWLQLLTHPMMTSLGALRATPDGLAAELAQGSEGYREAFREALQDIIDKGMADYDPKANLIALPNFLKYNKPESPNVVRAWSKAAEMLPECDLKELIIQRSVAFASDLNVSFRDAALKAFPKASGKAYRKTSPIQRAESREQRTEDSAYDREKPIEDTYTRETMFTAFPAPASATEGKAFLVEKNVPADQIDTCLRLLMGGNFSPYDLEGVIGRSAA